MRHGTRYRVSSQWLTEPDRNERANVSALDPVVYAIRRRDGIIKVGWTSDIARRSKELGGEVLAFQFGTREDEKALHARLADHLAHGREYYYPTPFVVSVINEMRQRLRLPALTH